jgi:hypothetical protein
MWAMCVQVEPKRKTNSLFLFRFHKSISEINGAVGAGAASATPVVVVVVVVVVADDAGNVGDNAR